MDLEVIKILADKILARNSDLFNEEPEESEESDLAGSTEALSEVSSSKSSTLQNSGDVHMVSIGCSPLASEESCVSDVFAVLRITTTALQPSKVSFPRFFKRQVS